MHYLTTASLQLAGLSTSSFAPATCSRCRAQGVLSGFDRYRTQEDYCAGFAYKVDKASSPGLKRVNCLRLMVTSFEQAGAATRRLRNEHDFR